MRINRRLIGEKAERLVVSYLLNNGYEVLAKNYRFRHCEIDLIARKEESLIFIEVKTCNNSNQEFLSGKIGRKKQEKLIVCAKLFFAKNFEKLSKIKNVRFDVIFVDLKRGEINHYEGAIRADGELISF